MKEGAIDCERAIVTHHQATEVAEPSISAFDDPTPLVTSQRATILRRRFLPVRAMRAISAMPRRANLSRNASLS